MSTNNRASLLAGLRTGGVRSTSGAVPQTAAPTITSFPRQEMPMTAAVGGSFNQMYAQAQAQAQAQAFQMQMMQMEIMRLQAIQQAQQAQQAQQYQLELARQQTAQTASRRTSFATEPQSAGPTATSFMARRASQAEQLKAQLHLNSKPIYEEPQVPMTASLGGKFGGRLNPNATTFRMGAHLEEEDVHIAPAKTGSTAPANTPVTPNYASTTVISGGTALGTAGSASVNNGTSVMPVSKSDVSLNWRRGAGSNTSMTTNTRSASLNVRITPPPGERVSPPPGLTRTQHRPEPLRFSLVINEPAQSTVLVDNSSDGENGEDDDASSASAKSEPTTPPSGVPPLSPREVASKRLYEGLGLGRPVAQSAAPHTLSFPGIAAPAPAQPFTSAGLTFPAGNGQANRVTSQPVRQPRGPPSNIDELGPKNFATRIRRKAIGGLGAMLDARVNRREVEAC